MRESNDSETDTCTNMKSKTGEFFLLTLINLVVFNQIEIEF